MDDDLVEKNQTTVFKRIMIEIKRCLKMIY